MMIRSVKQKWLSNLVLVPSILTCIAHSSSADEATDFFENRIRPVLIENCYQCHGQEKANAGLRLDTPAGFKTDDGQGSILEAKNESPSRLIAAIRHLDGVTAMPPDTKLTDDQIRDLEAWVESGAIWPSDTSSFDPNLARDHWAFRPIQRVPSPKNNDNRWSKNTIDRWIHHSLVANGLQPSEPASPSTLARRLSIDLTGLPPEEDWHLRLENYRDDPQILDEFIDELLASDAFAEHWARHWLDVARYGDTVGATFDQDDLNPFAYSYRDWVIRAFQEDMPYNAFVSNQLVADKHVEENDPAIAALGFLTVGLKFEGNAENVIDDQLDTIFRGLQGLSISCARCHDHKYDPIPTQDYYALYGILAESSETTRPIIRSEEDRVRFEAYTSKRNELREHFFSYRNEQHQKRFGSPISDASQYLLAVNGEDNGIEVNNRGMRSDGLHQTILDKYREVLMNARNEHHQVFAPWIAYLDASMKDPSSSIPSETLTSLQKRYRRFLEPTLETNASEEADSNEENDGTNEEEAADSEEIPYVNASVAEFFRDTPPSSLQELANRYAALFSRVATPEHRDLEKGLENGNDEEIRQLFFGEYPQLDVGEEDLKNLLEGEIQEEFEKRRQAIGDYEASDEAPEQARVFVDGPPEREQVVFIRGKSDRPGERVEARFLSILDPERETFSWQDSRQSLADAIVDPLNPLTARVWVNRVWGHLFGRGLVDTPSDFGVRGSAPTHPELLDALAADFVRHGWSTKRLIRTIVKSAAYQQSSSDQPVMLAIDPENKYLWRMNRKRLTAESLRDGILAQSYNLDRTMMGRPAGQDGEHQRRTLYSIVHRRLPSDFVRAFDFANPSLHTPIRHETIVPQQALWLLNSPFVTEQARALDSWGLNEPDGKQSNNEQSNNEQPNNEPSHHEHGDVFGDDFDLQEATRSLFQHILSREPSETELETMVQHVREWSVSPAKRKFTRAAAWRFGHALVDKQSKSIKDFEEFEEEQEGAWIGPDEMRFTQSGGDPGQSLERLLVRRWLVAESAKVTIEGTLSHSGIPPASEEMEDQDLKNQDVSEPSELEEASSIVGDGVFGWIMHNGKRLQRFSVCGSSEQTRIEGLVVSAGDTIDFVVQGKKDPQLDAFDWPVSIVVTNESGEEDSGHPMSTESERDFRTEQRENQPPLGPLARLAQVLWMSNEYLYVD